MEKSVKILLYVVLGVVLFQGLFNLFFSHSLLKDAVGEIKSVKSDLKVISDSLASSRKQIASMVKNLDENKERIDLMKSEVEILYLDYRKDETKFRLKNDSLSKELKEEEEYLKKLKLELDQLK
jgi:hypothetical protein